MCRAPRKLALLVVCAVALACSACSSSNKGKIEGSTWVNTEEVEKAPPGMVTAEFGTDGSFTMKVIGIPALTGKYSLGTGDYVTFTDVKDATGKSVDRGRVKIKIEGDSMTWTEKNGTYKFTRAKAKPEPKPGKE